MTESEAIAIAKRVAKENGWPWIGSGYAERGNWFQRIFYGRKCWEVWSHWGGRGCLVNVLIDDATGEVIRQGYDPR